LIVEILEARTIGIYGVALYPRGFEADMVAFYNLEPKKAFEVALSDLRQRVRSALIEASEE
jgi:hypothetical protein